MRQKLKTFLKCVKKLKTFLKCVKNSVSSPMFHARMKSLANCFTNVYLSQQEFMMDNQGEEFLFVVFGGLIICVKVEKNRKEKRKFFDSKKTRKI
jgi:hypothetical protein